MLRLDDQWIWDSWMADDGDLYVIAHATSADLTTWQLGPPLCAPGAGFGQLEVLHKIIDGRPLFVFTCHPQEMTAERIAASGEYCTWSLPPPGLLGPWDIKTGEAVHCRARSVRGTAGTVARRKLGDCRLPQPRTQEHRRVRDHRHDPGHPRRRGLSRGSLRPQSRVPKPNVHVGSGRSAQLAIHANRQQTR